MYKRPDAGGNAREAFGNFVINSDFNHKLYNCKSSSPGQPTEFRVFCAIDPQDLAIIPQVVPVDGDPLGGISDAFHAVELANFVGSKKYKFISETTDFPEKFSPMRTFYIKIKHFIEEEGKKRRPAWAEWLTFGGGLACPQYLMLTQGVLVRLNGDVVKDRSGKPAQIAPVILVFSRSATVDMENKLTTPIDESQPLSADNSVLGDITSPANGKTLLIDKHINNEGRERYFVQSGNKAPLDERYVKSTFVPWNKLLRRENARWQIIKLAETFDNASVDYAFSSDPDYAELVPDSIRGAFEGKTIITPGPATCGTSGVSSEAPVAEPAQDDEESPETTFMNIMSPYDVDDPDECGDSAQDVPEASVDLENEILDELRKQGAGKME